MRFDVAVPLVGPQPARGDVVSGGGSLGFGWRINNWVGVLTGITLLAHTQQTRNIINEFGDVIKVVDVGRLTAFDVAVARLYLPNKRRFQPYADIGGGASLYVPPFANADAGRWGGHGRFGVGFDGWITPNFTMGALGNYRLLGLERGIGHALVFSLNIGAHW